MEITDVFYPSDRREWRQWLEIHHLHKKEIWLQRYVKASGIPAISYDDLVEECLCFGWIDGVIKKWDHQSNVQRITPRSKKTFLSELNRQRIWKLQHEGWMTPAGIAPIADQIGHPDDPFTIPDWIADMLRADTQVWEQFQSFSRYYQRLKIGWIIESGNNRPEVRQQRMAYLIKMTRAGKMYGTQPLQHWEK